MYLALMSVHGLLRGERMELGRDADTGGQIKYVVELARALAEDDRVERVDLLTRRIEDAKVDDSYAVEEEELAPGARIVRLACGPRRYLRKEKLWPHLDSFIDQALQHFRRVGRVPDVLHGHYADAGYVAAQLAASLGVPMVFTGHSLGRIKEERLLARGIAPQRIETRFNIRRRIEAEETALDNATFVVASTRQEIDEQYARYHNYHPQRMKVIPPGVDLSRFRPPRDGEAEPEYAAEIDRFLRRPERPLILCISRADARKNLPALIDAFGGSERLRATANLAVLAGSREGIRDLSREPRKVLIEILERIDRHDLYGSVAYPKSHRPDDVPDVYRLAAARRGAFVNPALTEPFGLTLLEAAASGLPIVATDDGGPRDIVRHCRNGTLVDATDTEDIAAKLLDAVADADRWDRRAAAGLRGVQEHYSWAAHVHTYVTEIEKMSLKPERRRPLVRSFKSKLPTADRMLICDIDNTLIGDRDATAALVRALAETEGDVGFGVATGRRLDSAVDVLTEWGIPRPDVWITAVGAEIHYGSESDPDRSWSEHIDWRWDPEEIRDFVAGFDGLELQPEEEQREFKISYYVDVETAPAVEEIRSGLRKRGCHVNCIYSHGSYLDLLPVRASKGRAVRYLSAKWGLAADRLLTAGDSGNDEEMLSGDTLAVVVGNHADELKALRGRDRIYFSEKKHAWGVLDGMEFYRFLEQDGPTVRETAAAEAE